MLKRFRKLSENQEVKQEERELRREYFVFIPILIAVAALITFSVVNKDNEVAVELVLAPGGSGYWIVYEGGTVKNFGTAPPVQKIDVADGSKILAAQPAVNGFWAMTDKGAILPVLGAQYSGGVDSVFSLIEVVELMAQPNGRAYRVAAKNGQIYDFNVTSLAGGSTNRKEVVAAASTSSGDGYWLIQPDGSISTFGDASYFPQLEIGEEVIVDSAPYADGVLVLTNNGKVSVLGEGQYHGDMSESKLSSPVVDIDGSADGQGYLITTLDGVVTQFGNAKSL
jgi:hypothetical protein